MYTGREWDNDIQQYHYRARMFDASLGRFCSRDPIGYADGKQLYANYFGMRFMDPTGKLRLHPSGGGGRGPAIFPMSGGEADPLDGDGTDQGLCDFVMDLLETNAVGINQELLDHWIGGSGGSKHISFDHFDAPSGIGMGGERLRDGAINLFALSLGLKGTNLKCGATLTHSFSEPRPEYSNAFNTLWTPMIYGFRFWYDCSGSATKNCFCGWCTSIDLSGRCFFHAEDHVHFWTDPAKVFWLPIPGIYIRGLMCSRMQSRSLRFQQIAMEISRGIEVMFGPSLVSDEG
jgi:RHS repeat-associated protein